MGPVNVPILAFHQVSVDSVSIFERYIRHLDNHNYHCLSLPELLRNSSCKQALWAKTVVLTFDDGYEDFFTLAYPILNRYGFSATVFLVTDLVGGKSNWEGEKGSSLLSWERSKSCKRQVSLLVA